MVITIKKKRGMSDKGNLEARKAMVLGHVSNGMLEVDIKKLYYI